MATARTVSRGAWSSSIRWMSTWRSPGTTATAFPLSRSHTPVHMRPGRRTQKPSRPRKTWGCDVAEIIACASTQLLSTSPSLTPSSRATDLTVASLARVATVCRSLPVVRRLGPQAGSGSVNTFRQCRQRKRRFNSATHTSFPQSLASLLRWMCHWCTCQVERSHLGQTASLSRYCGTTSIHLPASLTASTRSPVSRRRIVIESSCTWPPFCSRFFAFRLQKRQVLLLTHLNCIHTEECRARQRPALTPAELRRTIAAGGPPQGGGNDAGECGRWCAGGHGY